MEAKLSPSPTPGKPKLLDRVREVLRLKHHSLRTEARKSFAHALQDKDLRGLGCITLG
jgi:hypothetical protein